MPSDKNMNSVSSTTRELFTAAGFTSDNDGSADLEITSAGFQFLLLSPVQQLWTYMIGMFWFDVKRKSVRIFVSSEYLKLETAKGRDIRPVIDLLIRVILCVVIGAFSAFTLLDYPLTSIYSGSSWFSGGDLSTTAFEINANWTEEQTTLVMHMRELGLIFIRKRKDGWVEHYLHCVQGNFPLALSFSINMPWSSFFAIQSEGSKLHCFINYKRWDGENRVNVHNSS